MNCTNCGFKNPASAARCEKCNSELAIKNNHHGNGAASVAHPDTLNRTIFDPPSSSDLRNEHTYVPNIESISKTIRGEQAKEPYIDRPSQFAEQNQHSMTSCSNCGYEVTVGSNFCPNCNCDLHASKSHDGNKVIKQQNKFAGTIDPYSHKGFSLMPMTNGAPSGISLEFQGDTVLNRANTIQDNQTITSKAQAEIKLENGEWYLIDKSEQQTTFVRAGQPIKLKKGDIILLGDTKFVFDK